MGKKANEVVVKIRTDFGLSLAGLRPFFNTPIMEKTNKYVDWLKDNGEYLTLRKIELQFKIPASTLQKFVRGERPLPPQYVPIIERFVKKLTKSLL